MDTPVRPPIPAIDFTTAIDHEIMERMLLFFREHGVVFVELDTFEYDARMPDNTIAQRVASNHRIRLPIGTMRYDGFMWGTSYDFRLVFPDGFELRGIYQMGMVGGDKTILFLPN